MYLPTSEQKFEGQVGVSTSAKVALQFPEENVFPSLIFLNPINLAGFLPRKILEYYLLNEENCFVSKTKTGNENQFRESLRRSDGGLKLFSNLDNVVCFLVYR